MLSRLLRVLKINKALFGYHIPGLVWPEIVPALFKILKKR